MGVHIVDEQEKDQLGFKPLMDQFWLRVVVEHVYADCGYDNPAHFEAVHAKGGRACIDFTDGRGIQVGKPHFNEMFKMHETDYGGWLSHYTMRNFPKPNNSSFKRTVKRKLRSRRRECIATELLAATVSFNLCRLHVARKGSRSSSSSATNARCASSTASSD